MKFKCCICGSEGGLLSTKGKGKKMKIYCSKCIKKEVR